MMTDEKFEILDLQETGVYCYNVLCLTVYTFNKVINMHTKNNLHVKLSFFLSKHNTYSNTYSRCLAKSGLNNRGSNAGAGMIKIIKAWLGQLALM